MEKGSATSITQVLAQYNKKALPELLLRGGFLPAKTPADRGKVSTGVGVMSYFGGNSFSQNLTVLPAPSVRGAVCAADWGS